MHSITHIIIRNHTQTNILTLISHTHKHSHTPWYTHKHNYTRHLIHSDTHPLSLKHTHTHTHTLSLSHIHTLIHTIHFLTYTTFHKTTSFVMFSDKLLFRHIYLRLISIYHQPLCDIIHISRHLTYITLDQYTGVDRFYDNLEMMYGFRLNAYMKICWKYLSPVFCVVSGQA